MPTQKLKKFLDENQVNYQVIPHIFALSALEVAEATHTPGKELAKTIIVKTSHDLIMVVASANEQINLQDLKKQLNDPNVRLATEEEFSRAFPDCEVGAMPPFGNLYDMDVFVTKVIADDQNISFNGGSHSEIVKINYQDYNALVHPTVI